MKKLLLCLIAALATTNAHAALSRSAFSALDVQIHGVFVSSDPSCQTGLVQTVPVSRGGNLVNFLSGPTLGSGFVPGDVNCIVVLLRNSIGVRWNAGNYTGSDAACSNGGSTTVYPCTSRTVSMPSAISSAMAAAGLTETTTCSSSPSGSEIVPLYISSNSACTGNSTTDSALGRSGCDPNPFSYPTTGTNTSSGIIMTGSQAQNAYAIVIDPTGLIGGVASGSSTSCTTATNPRFGARGGTTVSSVTLTNLSAPTITAVALSGSITPAAGTTSGGSTLVITGTGFETGAQVSLGSTRCTSPSVNSAGTQITCTSAAASAGVVTVTVTNPNSGLSATSGNSFEYRSAVTVTAIQPTQVPNGTSQLLTITGTGFRTASSLGAQAGTGYRVTLGATIPCDSITVAASGNSLTCTLPASSAGGPHSVYVTNYPDTTNSGSLTGATATGFTIY